MMKISKSIYLKTLTVTGIIQIIGFYLSFSGNPDSYNILDPFEYGLKAKLPLDIYTIISLMISLVLCIILPINSTEDRKASDRITLLLPTFWICIAYLVIYGLTVSFGLAGLILLGSFGDHRRFLL